MIIYFFTDKFKAWCDAQITTFMKICDMIKFPVSIEKTEWGTTFIIFLGLGIDTLQQLVLIPANKKEKIISLINWVIKKRNRKITLKQLQGLCGTLNFVGKCVVPGRAFTRRLYTYGSKLTKKNHHLSVTGEMKADLRTWLEFLQDPLSSARPFFHFNTQLLSTDIDFYTDASTSHGCGGICGEDWFIFDWDQHDLVFKHVKPSINYLELYAVVVGVVNWIHRFRNRKVTIHCDNQSVIAMINQTSSSNRNCMILIRIFVLYCLKNNVLVTARYIKSADNTFSDMLSRHQYQQFWRLARKTGKNFNRKSTPVPELLLPIGKLLTKKLISN